jgi:aminobenzoyl-glutamate utilization protein B
MKTIIDWISSKENHLISLSQKIWHWAELGLQEHQSAQLIVNELRDMGFSVETGIAGMPTAFIASYGSGAPIIGLLAEYDALPGLGPEPVAAANTTGHGCGHNLLGIGSLAAAGALKHILERNRPVSGTVKLFGTPGEEILSGKVFMAREGAFNQLDAALTWHPWDENTVWAGSSLAINSVKFRFQGLAAHAAFSPEKGRSALDAVELMNIGVNYLREHIIPEARVHYVITKGGDAPNIVPAQAEVWYYVRAPRRIQVEEIFSRIVNIASGAELMTGTTKDIEFIQGAYELLSNQALVNLLFRNLTKIGPPQFHQEEKNFAQTLVEEGSPQEQDILDIELHPPNPSFVLPGSTDLGDVSWIVPTANLAVAAWPKGIVPHSWQACAAAGMGIGFKAMIVAAKVLALTAWELLTQPEELAAIKAEFHRTTQGFSYKSPLPPDKTPPI